MIPVFRPSVSEKEINAVSEVLKSGWWGCGPKVSEFEDKFSKYLSVKYAVAENSCTAALHSAGKVLNLEKGSEVITSPITFISTAYLANYNNLKIVFADVEEDTLNLNPDDVKDKITDKTKIILPVHYGGHACDMGKIMNIAKENNLFVIEDCAHATGGKYKDKMLGSFGDISCFSFAAVKNLSTGDGGMFCTNNEEYAKKAKILRWIGINKETVERTSKDEYEWSYSISEVGHKFQMTDISAAIGIVQLERLKELNGRRKEITKKYNEAFSKVDWITIPVEKDYAYSSNHNYVIKVDKDRDKLMQYLKQRGISTGVHYLPIYKHPIYKDIKSNCPIAEEVWKKILTLPLFPDMTNEEVEKVVKCINKFR